MKTTEDYYHILGLDSSATPEDIKQAYRDLVQINHPDRYTENPRLQKKAEEQLKRINEAYEAINKAGLPQQKSKPQTGTNTKSQEEAREREARKREAKKREEAKTDPKPAASQSSSYSSKNAGEEIPIGLSGGISMVFCYIPAGSFMMGSNEYDDEKPVHQVTISKPFYMGKYEVTQAQWQAVMGNNPSRFKGENNPVEQVSWNDCQEFIRKLNALGKGTFRLPTEAEWEYACRAGTTTQYYWGDSADRIDDYAWYDGNSPSTTHPVGQKRPNAWGLYDMSGNVWEWCQDWFDKGYYTKLPETDPVNTETNQYRVLRGGSWNNHGVGMMLRSAIRGRNTPDSTGDGVGLRVVRTS